MLPLVDKPAIQYVVEEAVAGRHHRHPDHHRAGQAHASRTTSTAPSSSRTTSSRGASTSSSTRCGRSPSWPTSTTSARASRWAWATPCRSARQHVGDEPVRGPAGRRHHAPPASQVLDGMIGTYERVPAARWWRSRRFAPEEISSYGCVDAGAGRRQPGPGARHRREAAAGRGALEPGGDGPLRVHPRDLRRHRPGRARRRRRDPADRRHRAAASRSRPSTADCFADGRYDIGNKLDYLRATVEMAARPRGPRAGVPRASSPQLVSRDAEAWS